MSSCSACRCHMAAIRTLAEEDAKRPNRERERLVRERTRIVNRMKSCLVSSVFGTSSRRCAKHRSGSKRCRPRRGCRFRQTHFSSFVEDMARLRFVMDQIKQVEEARAQRLEQARKIVH